ncbi:MAG: hypothetical protein LBM38_01615 [Clostridiales bacterium]|jgi:hypothetical protein|nr:hypothetical protein [Clostridiales bacterium]
MSEVLDLTEKLQKNMTDYNKLRRFLARPAVNRGLELELTIKIDGNPSGVRDENTLKLGYNLGELEYVPVLAAENDEMLKKGMFCEATLYAADKAADKLDQYFINDILRVKVKTEFFISDITRVINGKREHANASFSPLILTDVIEKKATPKK